MYVGQSDAWLIKGGVGYTQISDWICTFRLLAIKSCKSSNSGVRMQGFWTPSETAASENNGLNQPVLRIQCPPPSCIRMERDAVHPPPPPPNTHTLTPNTGTKPPEYRSHSHFFSFSSTEYLQQAFIYVNAIQRGASTTRAATTTPTASSGHLNMGIKHKL
jgi:hypothetical protein